MAGLTRLALVTGGNRGIGFEICRQLASRGLAVVLTARDASKGKAAAKSLQDAGLDVEFHRLDVTSCRSIRACVAAVAERLGRIDVLVNNAGILADPRGACAQSLATASASAPRATGDDLNSIVPSSTRP